ncbi:MAG TPA: ROK family protein [Bryobacteraceae bacterium]|nr:ROK family protein [Bryobacteraceae bacterium]
MPKIRNTSLHALGLLKLLYQNVRISRSDLSAMTGFSAFLVSKLCDALLKKGFIHEVGSGDSSGGRRPTLLSIAPRLGKIAGLHVGRVNARLVITDIRGTELAFLKMPSRVSAGPDVAMPHLIGLVEKGLQEANIRREELLGIGVGISGILDRGTGTTLYWPKVPQWVNVPVRRIFADHFGIAPEIEDTPRTMALAERRLGLARQAENWVYLMIGASMGSAVFINRELYTGSRGFSGEFGHVNIKDDGPLCGCGNRGCLNTFVSATALIHAAQAAVSEGLSAQLWQLCEGDAGRISVALIVRAAAAGDRYSVRLLNDLGACLGKAMVVLIHLLDPELIIVGGGLAADAGQMLMPVIRKAVSDGVLPLTAKNLSIQVSELREVDWAIGASLLVGEKALEKLFLSKQEAPKSANRKSETTRRGRIVEGVPE